MLTLNDFNFAVKDLQLMQVLLEGGGGEGQQAATRKDNDLSRYIEIKGGAR